MIISVYPRKQKTPTQTMSVDIVTAITATTPIVTTAINIHKHFPHHAFCDRLPRRLLQLLQCLIAARIQYPCCHCSNHMYTVSRKKEATSYRYNFDKFKCGDLATGKTSETIFISRQAQLIRLRPKAACVARA